MAASKRVVLTYSAPPVGWPIGAWVRSATSSRENGSGSVGNASIAPTILHVIAVLSLRSTAEEHTCSGTPCCRTPAASPAEQRSPLKVPTRAIAPARMGISLSPERLLPAARPRALHASPDRALALAGLLVLVPHLMPLVAGNSFVVGVLRYAPGQIDNSVTPLTS